MPVTVLVWNLERLGDKHGPDPDATAISIAMIAAMVADLRADVVLVQELRQQGVPVLRDIVARLNVLQPGLGAGNAWRFDWIKGGLATGGAAAAFGDTSFNVTNSEGYAVLWRNSVLGQVAAHRSAGVGSVSVALRNPPGGAAFIDLCLLGNVMSTVRQANEPRITTHGAVPTFSGYPVPGCGTATRRFRTVTRRRRAAFTWVADRKVFVRRGSRRAVRIIVNTPGAGGAAYDVIGYHAPNGRYPSMYGPIIAINAHGPSAGRSIAGDWNTTAQAARRAIATTALAAHYASPTINANGTVPAGVAPSMVHPTGVLSTTWSKDKNVLTSHRDFNLYLPPAAAIQTEIPADLQKLFSTHFGASNVVAETGTYRPAITNQLTTGAWPALKRGNYTNAQIITAYYMCRTSYTGPGPTDLVAAATLGNADFYTAFALLMNRYISDHLPVSIVLP